MVKRTITAILIAFLLGSCSELLIEDHIEGTWELTSYHRNGVDETEYSYSFENGGDSHEFRFIKKE